MTELERVAAGFRGHHTLIGQFYPAIIVARLVAMEIAGRMKHER